MTKSERAALMDSFNAFFLDWLKRNPEKADEIAAEVAAEDRGSSTMYEPERPLEPPEPKAVMMCDICAGELYDDDDYYELDGSCMCDRCAQLWLLDRKRVV